MFEALLKRLFGSPPALAADAPVAISATPDEPVPFGYKTAWFAVKCNDPADVAEALALADVEPANWTTGIKAAHRYAPKAPNRVFLTPPIEGWVLAICIGFPEPVDAEDNRHRNIGRQFDRLMETLAKRFAEVRFFATHRVSGYDAWARARNGAVERVFCFADGQLLANRGAQTPEERKLGLPDLGERQGQIGDDYLFQLEEAREQEREAREAELIATGVEKREALQRAYDAVRSALPSEQDTVDLAGAWSVDPTKLDETATGPSAGLIGTLPKSY